MHRSYLIILFIKVAGMAMVNHLSSCLMKFFESLRTIYFTMAPSKLATYILRNVRMNRKNVCPPSNPISAQNRLGIMIRISFIKLKMYSALIPGILYKIRSIRVNFRTDLRRLSTRAGTGTSTALVTSRLLLTLSC